MKIDYTKLLAPIDFANHWDENVKRDDYHADLNAVNSSALKHMVKSPIAFHKNFSSQKEPTAAMKFGQLAHLAILEGEKFLKNAVVAPEFGDLRKKENKEAKETFMKTLKHDSILVTAEENENLVGMVESVLSNREALEVLKMGKPEVCGYWRDFETGIRCRMQADFVSFNFDILFDLKTTSDCSISEFRRTAENFNYPFQLMMYAEGVKAITGKMPEVISWLVVENQAPYECAIYEMSPHYQLAGTFDFRYAMNKLKQCIETKDFGRAQDESEIVEPSPWYFKKYDEKGAFENVTR